MGGDLGLGVVGTGFVQGLIERDRASRSISWTAAQWATARASAASTVDVRGRPEDHPDGGSHLFLGGGAGAGDALFDLGRGVFSELDAAAGGGYQGQGLGLPDCHAGLGGFAEVGFFDCDQVRLQAVDGLEQCLVDLVEALFPGSVTDWV